MAALRRTFAAGLLALAGCAIVAGAPTDGHYDGELCVATGTHPPSCGPADVKLSRGFAQVQVSDIVYRLQLRSSQAEVALMHGNMQIDEFTGSFDWVGSALYFSDPTKKASYEVVLGERKLAPK